MTAITMEKRAFWGKPASARHRRGSGRFRLAVMLPLIVLAVAVFAWILTSFRVTPSGRNGGGAGSLPPGRPAPSGAAADAEALRDLSRLESEKEKNPELYVSGRQYLRHVRLLEKCGRLADACALAAGWAEKDALFSTYLLQCQAGLLRRQDKFGEEAEVLGRLLQRPDVQERGALALRRAQSLLEAGQADEAAEAFAECLRLRTGSEGEALLGLLRADVKRKSWGEALAAAIRLLSGDRYPRQEADAALLVQATPELLAGFSSSEALLAEAALSLLRHRELGPAAELLNELIRRHPGAKRTGEYLSSMGRLYGYRDELDASLEWYGKALAAVPEVEPALLLAVARQNLWAGRDGEAKRIYLDVLPEVKSPSVACDIVIHLANIERRAGRAAAARAILRSHLAGAGKAERVKLLYRLALQDLRSGNARAALRGLAAVSTGLARIRANGLPDPDEVAYFTGLAQEKLGNWAGALSVWARAAGEAESYYSHRCEEKAASLAERKRSVADAVVARCLAQVRTAVKRRRPQEAYRTLTAVHALQGSSPAWREGLAALPAYEEKLDALAGLAMPAAPATDPAGGSSPLQRAVVFHRLGLGAEAAQAYGEAGAGELSAALGLRGARPEVWKDFIVASLAADGGDFRTSFRAGMRVLDRYPARTPLALVNPTVLALCWPEAYGRAVRTGAGAKRIEPGLVWSVMRQESNFSPRALSPATARGLMQVMPDTARRLCDSAGLPPPAGPDILFDPEFSIELGVLYLGGAFLEFREAGAAAASYNAGFWPARYWRGLCAEAGDDFFIPEVHIAETRRYVNLVLASMRMYARARDAGGPS